MASAQSIPPLSRLPDVPRPLANGDLLKFNFSTSSFGTVNEAAFALVADLGTASAYDVGTSAGEIPALGVGGKLLTSVLPALAITSRYVVASQAAMLALTAEEGDVAIRTDLSKSFILGTGSPTILGSWSELLTPTDTVLSVDGQTGVVDLSEVYATISALDAQIVIIDILTSSVNWLTETSHAALSLGTPNGLSLNTQQLSLAAATNSSAGAATAAQITALETATSNIASHTANVSNPHGVTKSQVGLGNVPNTDCTNASNISSGSLAAARLPPLHAAVNGPVFKGKPVVFVGTGNGDNDAYVVPSGYMLIVTLRQTNNTTGSGISVYDYIKSGADSIRLSAAASTIANAQGRLVRAVIVDENQTFGWNSSAAGMRVTYRGFLILKTDYPQLSQVWCKNVQLASGAWYTIDTCPASKTRILLSDILTFDGAVGGCIWNNSGTGATAGRTAIVPTGQAGGAAYYITNATTVSSTAINAAYFTGSMIAGDTLQFTTSATINTNGLHIMIWVWTEDA